MVSGFSFADKETEEAVALARQYAEVDIPYGWFGGLYRDEEQGGK